MSSSGGSISVYVGSAAATIAAVAAVAAVVLGVPSVTGGGGGAATANIWIEQGSGACAGGRSASPIAYSASASPDRRCGDFDTACQAMGNGDLALVKGSTSFAAQTLSSSCNGAVGSPKRICTAPGETVTITDNQAVLWNNSDYVIVCGNAEGWRTPNTTYGTFRWEATSQNFATGYQFQPGTTGSGAEGTYGDANGYGGDADVTACAPAGGATVCALNLAYLPGGTTNVTLEDNDWCCNNDKLIFPDNNGTPNVGLTIKGNYLHDQVKLTVSGGAHYECIYNNGTDGETIEQNLFNVCRATGAINTTCTGGCASPYPRNLTIQNNVILSTPEASSDNEHTPGVDGGLQTTGYLRYRNNLSKNGIAIYSNGVNELTGNVLPSVSTCGSANSTYNIYAVGSCGGTGDQTVAGIFTTDSYYAAGSGRTASLNYAPSATSPTVGAGNPSIVPATDILGCARPVSTVDAGPFEYLAC